MLRHWCAWRRAAARHASARRPPAERAPCQVGPAAGRARRPARRVPTRRGGCRAGGGRAPAPAAAIINSLDPPTACEFRGRLLVSPLKRQRLPPQKQMKATHTHVVLRPPSATRGPAPWRHERRLRACGPHSALRDPTPQGPRPRGAGRRPPAARARARAAAGPQQAPSPRAPRPGPPQRMPQRTFSLPTVYPIPSGARAGNAPRAPMDGMGWRSGGEGCGGALSDGAGWRGGPPRVIL
jgi:hypothetical protein